MSKTAIKRTKVRRDTSGRKPRGLLYLTESIEEKARKSIRRDESILEARTERQAEYINAIRTNTLSFGIGPAGTGKTFVAASLACEALMSDQVERIIITRPCVEAGEALGFMPGDLSEKFAPYFAPVRQVLERRLGRGAVEMYLKSEKILILPLAHMRGWTLENAFVLLDEAQNTTPAQMKLFLTRLGEHTTMVIDGDIEQSDIEGLSGLEDSIRRLYRLDGVSVVEFDDDDIVRSGLTKEIIKAYRKPLVPA
jgi:phosphate starvation-inducible PhoH-like protein